MISVGQKLWFVPSEPRDRGKAREITVTAVGRKWAMISGMRDRLEIATMRMESTGFGWGRAGDVYLSEGDYLRELERQKAWDGLRAAVSGTYSVPTDVQVVHITEARKLLGLSS